MFTLCKHRKQPHSAEEDKRQFSGGEKREAN